MKVIAPYFEILEDLDSQSLAVRIEACGRICYKSEDKISPE
jgi:thymidylate synthase (FAD)